MDKTRNGLPYMLIINEYSHDKIKENIHPDYVVNFVTTITNKVLESGATAVAFVNLYQVNDHLFGKTYLLLTMLLLFYIFIGATFIYF